MAKLNLHGDIFKAIVITPGSSTRSFHFPGDDLSGSLLCKAFSVDQRIGLFRLFNRAFENPANGVVLSLEEPYLDVHFYQH